MEYKQRIQTLIEQVPLVDLTVPRERGRMPTQASSEFTTNREQGDWAEKVIQRAINQSAKNHIAIRYGKSDDRVAGEDGFTAFFSDFQDELDSIGKALIYSCFAGMTIHQVGEMILAKDQLLKLTTSSPKPLPGLKYVPVLF